VMVSDIVQYFYCPRKVYYLKTLGVPFKVKKKMELGKNEDDMEEERLGERKTIYGIQRSLVNEIIHNIYLEDESLGLAGQVDTLLHLKGNEYIPVDSKYTEEAFVQRQYRKQLLAYSILIDKTFRCKVRRGIIYFIKQKAAECLEITELEKKALIKDVESIRRIIAGESIPRKSAESKCEYCEVRKFCV
jgi:CRISPR-associated exonuclease Cas4